MDLIYDYEGQQYPVSSRRKNLPENLSQVLVYISFSRLEKLLSYIPKC